MVISFQVKSTNQTVINVIMIVKILDLGILINTYFQERN